MYRLLRTINPSPYMFYFSSDDLEVAGVSLESLVQVENSIVHTFPLTGTRKRGKPREEDADVARDTFCLRKRHKISAEYEKSVFKWNKCGFDWRDSNAQ